MILNTKIRKIAMLAFIKDKSDPVTGPVWPRGWGDRGTRRG